MDIIDTDAIADPRWLLAAYAPELHALIKTAPDPADLSETAPTTLQVASDNRYRELVGGTPADGAIGRRSSVAHRPPPTATVARDALPAVASSPINARGVVAIPATTISYRR